MLAFRYQFIDRGFRRMQFDGGGTWIRWISDMHFDNIDLEFDSKLAVDAFNDIEMMLHTCSFVSQFTNLYVEFSRKQENEVPPILIMVATCITCFLLMKCYNL